jgi:hypothetical protein
MQRRCPGRVLVVDLGLTVWDIWSGYKDPFGLCPAGQDPGTDGLLYDRRHAGDRSLVPCTGGHVTPDAPRVPVHLRLSPPRLDQRGRGGTGA